MLSPESIASLEARLGVTFTDKSILLRSLSHRSWCSEHGDVESNERLEFLGDSVLGVVVTSFVFDEFAGGREIADAGGHVQRAVARLDLGCV